MRTRRICGLPASAQNAGQRLKPVTAIAIRTERYTYIGLSRHQRAHPLGMRLKHRPLGAADPTRMYRAPLVPTAAASDLVAAASATA